MCWENCDAIYGEFSAKTLRQPSPFSDRSGTESRNISIFQKSLNGSPQQDSFSLVSVSGTKHAENSEETKEKDSMKKVLMIVTLAMAYLAATGAASAFPPPPPDCMPDCPWVR